MTAPPSVLRAAAGFVLRAPLLPLDVLSDLGGRPPAATPEEELAAVERRLRVLVADPVVREALFLASPSLDDRLESWLAGHDEAPARTTRSVLSYVVRMASRCTPFGLFAGCAVGAVGGDHTVLRLGAREESVRHTRLDFEHLTRLAADVAADPAAREALVLVPNTSLYRAGGRLRMAEAHHDGDVLRYHRVAIEEDEVLAGTLQLAADGARIGQLVEALVDDEITADEAHAYVEELVDAQVLVPDLAPAVTGPEPAPELAASLLAHPATAEVGGTLARAVAAIEELDRAGVGRSPASYRAVADGLAKAPTEVRIGRLFQADLHLASTELGLGDEVVQRMSAAVMALHRMAHRPPESELDSFIERFQARYEGAEVPLLEALDEEVGVSFGSSGAAIDGRPLLAGPVPPSRNAPPRRTSHDDALLALFAEHSAAGGGGPLVLDAAALDRLAAADPLTLPDALAAHATLLRRRDGGLRVVLHSASGPSGARLLGRFCHGDEAIDALVREHLAGEEALAPGARFFEVVHVPEGRVGNVLCRPVLRGLEVAYLGRSGAPPADRLPATDLLVSVAAGRVVLRSERLGCEVVPRLSTAHNYVASRIALYRFLGALQGHRTSDVLVWSWGALSLLPALPRVELADGTVLSRAVWTLSAERLRALAAARAPGAVREEVDRIRSELGLPRRVAVAFADNELVLDLEAAWAAPLLAHEARTGRPLALVEALADPDEAVVTSPAGRHAHEVLLPFVVDRPPRPAVAPRRPGPAVVRTFPPGSAWLSLKLYCGAGTADAVLREAVRPVVGEARGAGLIDRWFFLRYGDPDWHLRVRFHGEPASLAGVVLPKVHSACRPLLDDGRLSSVVADTYRREVERYGGRAGIELFEAWSSVDSDAAVDIVSLAEGDSALDVRWRAAVAGVDGQLRALGFDVPTRRRLVRGWRDGLVAEHGELGRSLLHHAGGVHRREGRAVAALLSGAADLSPGLELARQVLLRRDAVLAGLGQAWRDASLDVPLEEVAGSLTHLHVNRLLRGALRAQELVVYDLLDRWYRRPV